MSNDVADILLNATVEEFLVAAQKVESEHLRVTTPSPPPQQLSLPKTSLDVVDEKRKARFSFAGLTNNNPTGITGGQSRIRKMTNISNFDPLKLLNRSTEFATPSQQSTIPSFPVPPPPADNNCKSFRQYQRRRRR